MSRARGILTIRAVAFVVARVVAVVAALLVLAAPPVRADTDGEPDPEVAREPRLVELGAAALGRFDFGDFCRTDVDVVTCTSGRAFAGVEISPRLRLSPLVSLGAVAAFAWKLGSEGTASSDGSHEDETFTTYLVAAEARLHPLEPGAVDLWLGAHVGFTALRRSVEAFDAGGRSSSTQSSTDFAPLAGAAIGVDFVVSDFLALGPELRGALFAYGEEPAVAVSLGIGGTILVGP